MKCNVGGIDRILRISVGIVLVALAANGIVGWWGWLGLIPLATGIFRFRTVSNMAASSSMLISGVGLPML